MANFDLKFIDLVNEYDFIKVKKTNQTTDGFNSVDCIEISGVENDSNFQIILDKSTAIKFAKTLRTEINKITESEVSNGRK